MVNSQAPLVVSVMTFYVLFSMFAYKPMAEEADQNRKVHIVYLGERQYDDINLTTESHHDLLAKVLGSKEKSLESMVYSYRHGFSGFAAKLTKSQAQQLAEIPGVIRVFPSSLYKLHTTRSWDFLGLSSSSSESSNLLHRAKMGDNVIIGVIDSGFWPESASFGDKGLGPIPSRWKGRCKSGELFNSTNCNRKVIGARWFVKGFIAEHGREALANDWLSARDIHGHGTHTASTAAGSFVTNVSYHGLGAGTLRGGAPLARLAIYKVVWSGGGSEADLLKGIDVAIHDGVDVLSISLGGQIPLVPEFDQGNGIGIGSFHAIARGISVVCAGGNEGPYEQTVLNTAPWILTVAATTMDRAFPSSITLEDHKTTYLGQSFFYSKKDLVAELSLPPDRRCDDISENENFSGKVVLCFTDKVNMSAATAVMKANGSGIIVAGESIDILIEFGESFPFVVVDPDVGTKLFFQALDDSNPMVRLRHAKTIIGKSISTRIAHFSSRGPNSASPAILKPDIAAPGSNILAAAPPHTSNYEGFDMMSGTSMSTPHVAGIVALIKSLHPTWSPAAIKSTLITTARAKNPSGLPIFASGSPPKVADPFDYGGGVVDPNAAADPGLIYDLGTSDYVYYYLCAMGYKVSDIAHLTKQKTKCPLQRPSVLDLNLPTITVPELTNSTTVTRTVTNVGNMTSIYRAVVEPPPGIKVSVEPRVLVFNSKVKKISFKVTISTTMFMNYGYSFGTLTWTDGVHLVKSPLSVRVHFF